MAASMAGKPLTSLSFEQEQDANSALTELDKGEKELYAVTQELQVKLRFFAYPTQRLTTSFLFYTVGWEAIFWKYGHNFVTNALLDLKMIMITLHY